MPDDDWLTRAMDDDSISDEQLTNMIRSYQLTNMIRSYAASPTWRSRLSLTQRLEILRRYFAGDVTQTQLADEYGVDQTTISRMVVGKTNLIRGKYPQD